MRTFEALRTRRLLLFLGTVASLNCASNPPPTHPTVDVTGVVRDRDGFGVQGVEVFFDPADDDRTVGLVAPTDRNGAFHIRVRPGPYAPQIFARHARVPAATLDTVWLRAPVQRLDYRYGGIKIQGRLLDPGGRPIPSGSIQASGRYPGGYDVSMEAPVTNGRYTLFGPPSNYYFDPKPLPARFPRYHGISIFVPADTTIDFRLDGFQVVGKVVLGGEVIDNAEVEVVGPAYGSYPYFTARDRTGRDGTFRVFVPSGRCSFSVKPGPAHAFVARQDFDRTVTMAQTIRFDMSGTAWSGTLREKMTGSPVASVKVTATQDRSDYFSASCVSDRRGRFRLALHPGLDYVLSLSSTKTRVESQPTPPIRAGNDSTFELKVGIANP
jgi:hypothetical protein